jgi:hypothetical protein
MSAAATRRTPTASNKLLFLHLPKTAGLALDAFLVQHFDRDQVFPFHYEHELSSVSPADCQSYAYFRGHLFLDSIRSLLREDVTSLTIVRDPIKRFISNFAHWQRPQTKHDLILDRSSFRRMTIEDFVRDEELIHYTGLWNLQTRLLASRVIVDRSAHGGIVPEHHEIPPTGVSAAIDRLKYFAWVGLFERLTESLQLLSYTFGCTPVRRLQFVNVSPEKPNEALLSRMTVQRIQEINDLDMQLYSYTQQAFADRYQDMEENLLRMYAPGRSTRQNGADDQRDLLDDLLLRHYDRCFSEAHEPTHDLDIDFDHALPGLGWHAVEADPSGRAFRWTGPDSVTTIDLPLAKDRPLHIRLHVLMAIAPDVVAGVTMSAEECPIELVARPDAGGVLVLDGVIPRAALAHERSFTRVTIGVPRTVAPAALDARVADTRELGICLHRIEISAA